MAERALNGSADSPGKLDEQQRAEQSTVTRV